MELGKQSLKELYQQKELEPQQLNRIVKDTLKGLQELYYQKIIHRDIKPDNILLMPDGTYKITDFGVSRQLDDLENSITLIGTPQYFPPEIQKYQEKGGGVFQLSKEKSAQIDWYGFDTYSLGLTLLAAVCRIDQMFPVVKNNQQLEELEKSQAKKTYDPKVYEIIKSMIQEKQEDRPTPGELLLYAQDLEV